MKRLAVVGAISLAVLSFSSAARADDTPSRCIPLQAAHDNAVNEHHGRWIEVTDTQRAFLVGLYVLDPATPAGMPFGDKAAIAWFDDNGVAIFIDGDKACSPMAIPKQVLQMVTDIGAGVVTHEGVSQ